MFTGCATTKQDMEVLKDVVIAEYLTFIEIIKESDVQIILN
jgi:hypothetical protein